jgi:hypothetical protein
MEFIWSQDALNLAALILAPPQRTEWHIWRQGTNFNPNRWPAHGSTSSRLTFEMLSEGQKSCTGQGDAYFLT